MDGSSGAALLENPLLETKLYAPRWRRGLVQRPRLSQRLNAAAQSKLTVVSAPAGFGKTTLVAEWLAAVPADERGDERESAWLSLESGDNHPPSFWTYLIAALQTVLPGVGASVVSSMRSPQPPPIETMLAPLLNELGAIAHDVVLVLDDYHVVDAHDIHAGMVFLVDHLPPRMHLVIASRADPPWPLARLRAHGELVEIRAADLRFTPDEAAAYLNQVMGLELTARDVATLEDRTEGWIAALQLAALSMRGRDDLAGFIAGFAGDDRYIVDFLVEEVLQRQPARVRSFLVQTSILERLSPSLCNAVTGQDDGKTMLEALDRGNLFVVPLDDRRRWYRYHHLFADVVRAHLTDDQPEAVPDLHRRASGWYEQYGDWAAAVRHALAAGDVARVADLAELAMPALRRSRQAAAVLGWLEALPDDLVRCRPVLSTGYAWVLLEAGRLEAAEARLQDAERWLDTPAAARSAAMVVIREDEFRELPATIALYRAARAQALGDVASTRAFAGRVLDLVQPEDHLRRGSASALLGLAYWTSGDLEAAHRLYAEGMAHVQRAGHISDAISGALVLADFRTSQGRLHAAARTLHQALQLASEQGEPPPRGTADVYAGLSELHCERDELDSATQHLLRSKQLGERTGLPQNQTRWCTAMARVRAAHGDLDGALDLLEEAERQYVKDFFPDVRPVAALKARVWVRQGRLHEATGWAREKGLAVTDDLNYVREFEHVTLARVLLASGAVLEASRLLKRVLEAAEQGQRTGSAIEILVLQALAHQAQGDMTAALTPLQRALSLAEPEGYVRLFVDEGARMAALLEQAAKHAILPGYVRRLRISLGAPESRAAVKEHLLEPLSERELDVLRLLGTDLDGPEIARELVVSLNTMRTHTRNIYTKLGVNTRRAAVRRAGELELLV